MPEFAILSIDHVQLAMPVGSEERARDFYCKLLGMTEIAKPATLARRGGAWFASGLVQVHLGVETDFRPARKAHPALRIEGYDVLLAKLRAAGIEVKEDSEIPGVRRAYIDDPFGNRIEVIEN